MQVGYFFNEIWPAFPAPLELAGRYVHIRPNLSHTDEVQEEVSLVVNWFFNGHRNKLSSSMAWVDLQLNDQHTRETQLGIQWEFSF